MTFKFVQEDSPDRISIHPIQNEKLWKFLKQTYATTWFSEDVLSVLPGDKQQWDAMDVSERHCVKNILGFFAGADKLVADNINFQFLHEVPIMEAQYFYSHQAFMENIHAETYSATIDTYFDGDHNEKTRVFSALKNTPEVAAKGTWIEKYSDPYQPYAKRLVAFIIFEGIFFSGCFAIIMKIKSKGLLPGLALSNDYIAKDEGSHCKFACMLYNQLRKEQRLSQEDIHQLFKEALEVERQFVDFILRVPEGTKPVFDLKPEDMFGYIKHIANYWLRDMGYGELFENHENPLPYMRMMGLGSKVNFFETRNTEYKISGVGQDPSKNTFGYDDDF
jgi:ribonucleoside-diphosphate reductase beta chain